MVGDVPVGGQANVVVQSMTNTDTADAKATVNQILELWQAGSEIVRITVNSPEAAAQVGNIRQQLDAQGCHVHWWAIFTTTDIAYCQNFPTVRKRYQSTASTPAMWARATSVTASSAR